MAIQLNDRDLLIFQLIDEHRVLLEKHISWFISGEDKPVLIRDRLRKLFYLDYLLCHRHGTKLPWWTTPTKPLVYMLSGISRSAANVGEEALDLYDSEIQRHFLEVANLRMLGLIDQKDEKLSKFTWTTVKTETPGKTVDAFVTFVQNARTHKVAVVNHAAVTTELISSIDEAIKSGAEHVLLVSRDDAHQAALQKVVAQSGSINIKRCLFATHHEIYREGLITTTWTTCDNAKATVFAKPVETAPTANWANMPVATAV